MKRPHTGGDVIMRIAKNDIPVTLEVTGEGEAVG